jgi:hypothetical protein
MNPRSPHHSLDALPRGSSAVAMYMPTLAHSFLVSHADQRIGLMLAAAGASNVEWTLERLQAPLVTKHLHLLASWRLWVVAFRSRIGVKCRPIIHSIVEGASLDGR